MKNLPLSIALQIAFLFLISINGSAQAIETAQCGDSTLYVIKPAAIKKLDSVRVELSFLKNETSLQAEQIRALQTYRAGLENDISRLSEVLNNYELSQDEIKKERDALRKANQDLRKNTRALSQQIKKIKRKNAREKIALGGGAILAIILIILI